MEQGVNVSMRQGVFPLLKSSCHCSLSASKILKRVTFTEGRGIKRLVEVNKFLPFVSFFFSELAIDVSFFSSLGEHTVCGLLGDKGLISLQIFLHGY